MEWITYLGLSPPDIFAGFAGGIVNVFLFRRTEPRAMVGAVVVGALVANYTAAHFLSPFFLNERAQSFFVGAFGVGFIQATVAFIKAWKGPPQ